MLVYLAFAQSFGWTPAQVDELDVQVVADLMLAMKYQKDLTPEPEVPSSTRLQ